MHIEGITFQAVDPVNARQLADATYVDVEGFGLGADPAELPEGIAFIAKEGMIWLAYREEDATLIPKGVLEFIPLERALDFYAGHSELAGSSLLTIVENQERVFESARRYAADANNVYHHGIAIVPASQERGMGSALLNHGLTNTPFIGGNSVTCFIDIAEQKDNGLQPLLNERSYRAHLRQGFGVVGVANAPVYDDSISYLVCVRTPTPWNLSNPPVRLGVGQDAQKEMAAIRELTSSGHVGVAYSARTREFIFTKQ